MPYSHIFKAASKMILWSQFCICDLEFSQFDATVGRLG